MIVDKIYIFEQHLVVLTKVLNILRFIEIR